MAKPKVISRIQQFWSDRIRGRPLPNYDAACEELGGKPWLAEPEETDDWFISPHPGAALRMRSSSDALYFAMTSEDSQPIKHNTEPTRGMLIAGGALGFIVMGLISVVSTGQAFRPRHTAASATALPAAAIASPPAAAIAVASPVPAAAAPVPAAIPARVPHAAASAHLAATPLASVRSPFTTIAARPAPRLSVSRASLTDDTRARLHRATARRRRL